MRAAVASLIGWTITYDEIKQPVKTESSKTVPVKVHSVTRQEWADAGRVGLNPQVMLSTPRFNYSGELAVDFEGKRYGVYRTYERGDIIELYLNLKGGSDGIVQS